MGNYSISPSMLSDIDVGPSIKFNIPAVTPTSSQVQIAVEAFNADGVVTTITNVTYGVPGGGDVQTAQGFVDAINAAAAAGTGARVKANVIHLAGQDWVWVRAIKDTKNISVLVVAGGILALETYA